MAGWPERAARLLRAAADHLHPDPLPGEQTTRLVDNDELSAIRAEHALSLVDDNCHGYLLIRLVEQDDGSLRLIPEHAMPSVAWPAVHTLLGTLRQGMLS